MARNRWDVGIVGAGPAGSTLAEALARAGREVCVWEEHPRVGRPVQCAGLVSPRLRSMVAAPKIFRRAIFGATVYGPWSARVEFRAPDARAYVLDRAGLDEALADRAARAGAEFRCGERFVGAKRNGAWQLSLDGERGLTEAQAALLAGADGVASAVARTLGIRRRIEILPAFEAEFADVPLDPDRVEVYLGRRLAPGLFGWAIPDGEGGARIGVAAEADGTSAREYFGRVVERVEGIHGCRLRAPTAYIASGIPIGAMPQRSANGAVLVGDAAAQVKPLSGGGIFTGMRAALLAAPALLRALEMGDASAAVLAAYDRAWEAEFGGEFHRALRLRRIFRSLTDEQLERLVAALREAALTETIVAFGDIDFPSGLAARLLRQSPSLFSLLPRALLGWLGEGGPRAPDLAPSPERR